MYSVETAFLLIKENPTEITLLKFETLYVNVKQLDKIFVL